MPSGCALFTRCWRISRPFRQPNDNVLTIYIHHFSVFQIWCFYSVKTNTCHNESCLTPTWGWWKSFRNAMCCCMACACTRITIDAAELHHGLKNLFPSKPALPAFPESFQTKKKRKWTMEPPKLAGLYRCVSFSKAIFSKFGGVWKMNILFPKGWFSGSFRRSFLGGEAEVGKPTNPQPGAKGGGSIARVSGSFLAARKTWGVFHKERFLGGTFVPGKLRQKREVVVNSCGSVQWE